MALPANSRTCFALLSSIEYDLRQAVIDHADGARAEDVLGSDLLARATGRHALDHPRSTNHQLSSLLPYIDFADALQLVNRLGDRLAPEIRTSLKAIRSTWESLIPVRNRVAHSRPLEEDDLWRTYEFTEELIKIPLTDWSAVRGVKSEMERNPGFTLGLDHQLRVDAEEGVRHNLPPADFSETGFLGRANLRKQVRKALNGPWPVISILGDGGLGKTALALQVAYDISTDPDSGFDAIVWTTAKNKTLTTAEIQRIEGAIQDSLGLFAGAAKELAGDVEIDNPIEELLEYLESFKILLVLDNLETVIDDRIRDFLRALPNGSKVLITSRIGVGTENPFKLGPLEQDESVRLLRVLARTRDVHLLTNLHQDEAERLADQLKGHPAYIKWFVSGVQAGVAPEQIIENNDLLLDYCMENVFEYLTEDARAVLRSMLVAPGVQTLAELAYLNDFDSSRISQAVLDLTTTNFLSSARGGPGGTGYSLSDFAKTYLTKTYPVTDEERAWVLARQSALYQVGADLQASHQQDPYDPERVDVRGAGDFNAARLLLQALESLRLGEHDHALRLVEEAAELAPGYHEAFRVRGSIHEKSFNFAEAHDSYEHAVELAPKSASARFFYGQFLVQSGQNPRSGLRELQTATKLDQGSARTRLAVAEAHVAVRNYQDAIEVCASIVGADGAFRGFARPAVDQALRAAILATNQAVSSELWSEVAALVEIVVDLVERAGVDELSPATLDACLLLEGWATRAQQSTADTYISTQCSQLGARLQQRRRQADPNSLARVLAVAQNIKHDKGFAFVAVGEQVLFMHASALRDRHLFDSLIRGSLIACQIVESDGAHANARDSYWII